MRALIIIEGLVILGLTVLVAGLLRSHAEILRTLHQLGAGDDMTGVSLGPTRRTAGGFDPQSEPRVIPTDVTGSTPSGRQVSVALTGSRGLVLLSFLSSGCGSCKTIWEALAVSRDLPGVDRVVAVTKSEGDESISAIRNLTSSSLTTIMSSEAWQSFKVPYTPYFALVDAEDGRMVGDGAASSWDQLVSLVGGALGDTATRNVEPRRTTSRRLADSDEELERAGLPPGDSALYHRPGDDR